MSLPRYKITMLALSLGVASAFVGCSSNPSKKEVVDKGPQSSEQVYFEKAQKSAIEKEYGNLNVEIKGEAVYAGEIFL